MTTSDSSPNGVRVSLNNVDLWQKFYPINEMRVVKAGRKLFPDLDVSIDGLVPDVLYTVSLYLERVDNYKYKFIKDNKSGIGQWEVMGHVLKNNIPIDKKPHKDGVRSGSHWMCHPISFSSIYITHDPEFNEIQTNKMAILVSTMHKYQPVITVKRLSDGKEEEFRLTMTEFMVVTTYQNPKIIELKTENNKHAKKSLGVKRSATVTPPVGFPASPAVKKIGSVSQGHQNRKNFATTGPNNFQNQMTTSPTPPADGVHVTLKNLDVWQKFYPNMEMVVIRTGCRLFPGFEISIEGLDPDALYTISIYLERVDNLRYKFSGGQWKKMSDGYSILPIDKKLHMDGVKNGSDWMSSPVSFSNVHITNDPDFSRDLNDYDPILVHSLHKYRPVITVERLSDGKEEEFRFPMTEFMVVTRYKNSEIVALKDALNNYSRRFQCRKQGKKRVAISDSIPLSAVVIGPGSPFLPSAKMTAPSSQGHPDPMKAPPAMAKTPSMTPPTVAPQTMDSPSTDPSDFQVTPPTTAVSPSMTPITMTLLTMTRPPSMGATSSTPSSGGSLTPPAYEYAWNHQYGTWDMSQKVEEAPVPQWNQNQGVDDFQNSQRFGKSGNVPQSNFDFPQYNRAGTSSQSVVSPPSMTPRPAHNYTINQHWNPCGTWNTPQMSGGATMTSEGNMMPEAEQGYSGSIPNDLTGHTTFSGTGTSSQQGSDDLQNSA
ncbi:unnamed protein product [Caenorhabditis brenneri]